MKKSEKYSLLEANALFFAHLFAFYEQLTPEIQKDIKEIIAVINDVKSDEEDRQMSLNTLVEALFPEII